ncbi:hypothetical protein M0804_008826 [Polistes exclamans]|nr:hypothetical protein M0804_008826 [Polistes exclamans]
MKVDKDRPCLTFHIRDLERNEVTTKIRLNLFLRVGFCNAKLVVDWDGRCCFRRMAKVKRVRKKERKKEREKDKKVDGGLAWRTSTSVTLPYLTLPYLTLPSFLPFDPKHNSTPYLLPYLHDLTLSA